MAKIEEYAEKQLFNNNSTGAIFWLKNRGWRDKQELQHAGNKENPLQIIVNPKD